jgi:hypothetical protein
METLEKAIHFTAEILGTLKSKVPSLVYDKLTFFSERKFTSLSEFEEIVKEGLLKEEFEEYGKIICDDEVFTDEILTDEKDTEAATSWDDISNIGIDIKNDNQSIYELVVRKWDNKQLRLDPDFQRNDVWKAEQKSQFIESVLLGFPLPPFYFNIIVENKKFMYVVVDGRQRLTTLHSFIHDKFKLQGLKVLTRFNGKSFSDLKDEDDTLRSKIEDKQLTVCLIPASVPMEMVYDIFNRINTGGTQLQRQEIRNCIYLGQATLFLKELASYQEFKNAIDNGISGKRMKDQEAVLRYLSFQLLNYKTQYRRMNDFLGDTMMLMNVENKFPLEKRNEIAANFKRVMMHTFDFFGNRNFRIPTPTTRGFISIAVLESVCYFFSKQTDNFLMRNKEVIQENFSALLKDADYIDAVRFSTGDEKRVTTRIEVASKILSLNTL